MKPQNEIDADIDALIGTAKRVWADIIPPEHLGLEITVFDKVTGLEVRYYSSSDRPDPRNLPPGEHPDDFPNKAELAAAGLSEEEFLPLVVDVEETVPTNPLPPAPVKSKRKGK